MGHKRVKGLAAEDDFGEEDDEYENDNIEVAEQGNEGK